MSKISLTYYTFRILDTKNIDKKIKNLSTWL